MVSVGRNSIEHIAPRPTVGLWFIVGLWLTSTACGQVEQPPKPFFSPAPAFPELDSWCERADSGRAHVQVSRALEIGEHPVLSLLVLNDHWDIVLRADDFEAEDGPEITVHERSYTNRGELQDLYIDEGDDGTVDKAMWSELDDQGRIVKRLEDNDADGAPEFTETFTFDADGNLVERVETDLRFQRVLTWTYDDLGYQRTIDLGADGVVDSIESNSTSEDGTVTWTLSDGDADGETDSTIRRTRDDNLKTIELAYDFEADGAFDHLETWTRDPNGRPLLIETDVDNDAHPEFVTHYTYGTDTVRVEHMREGQISSVFLGETRDGLTRETKTLYQDGVPTEHLVSVTDESGREVFSTIDVDADGSPELRIDLYSCRSQE